MIGRDLIHLTYVVTDLKIGGAPLNLYRLATRLPTDRFRVRVISLADDGEVGPMLRQAGIRVCSCGARSAWDVRALWRLWRLLRAERVDVIHTILFHANLAVRLVGPPAGIPVYRILCEIQTIERQRRWHLVLDNMTCRWCACEMGISPSVVDHLHKVAHIPLSRLDLEMGGVDAMAMAAADPISKVTLNVAPDAFIIVWVGRFDPIKGFEEMLSAFAGIRSTRRIQLVLVGDGPYRPTIERLIADQQLTGRVVLLGERTDVPAILKAADLFLFCSRTEGLPTALLEAMAAGLAVVATDIPGCRDLIQHGETGILVKKGSIRAITEAIEALLDDLPKRQQLGMAAQKWVREYMDISELIIRRIQRYTAYRRPGPVKRTCLGRYNGVE